MKKSKEYIVFTDAEGYQHEVCYTVARWRESYGCNMIEVDIMYIASPAEGLEIDENEVIDYIYEWEHKYG